MKKLNYKSFKVPFIIIICILIIIAIFSILKEVYRDTYDWTPKVQKHISQYKCDFILLDTYKDKTTDYKDEITDAIIYKYQTNDDLQIVFDVECKWDYLDSPFTYKTSYKGPVITDNFQEQIRLHVSETKGTITLDTLNEKSRSETDNYIKEVVKYTHELLKSYVKYPYEPVVDFTILYNGKTYKYYISDYSEQAVGYPTIQILNHPVE